MYDLIEKDIEVEVHKITDMAKTPYRATSSAAAFDLHACFYNDDIKANGGQSVRVKDNDGIRSVNIFPHDRFLIPTGLILLLPRNIKAAIYPRSGLAYNSGLTVINSPGTIDSDYSNELFVILINHSDIPITIKNGDRIAQIEFVPVITDEISFKEIPIDKVNEFKAEQKRQGGIGHTGK